MLPALACNLASYRDGFDQAEGCDRQGSHEQCSEHVPLEHPPDRDGCNLRHGASNLADDRDTQAIDPENRDHDTRTDQS